ncbi:MAG: ferrous iron transport protein B [Oscillospiraceae bacterium]|nr:ferrous iron transport protein B [Oscillospiraceae bacterium]
MDSKTIALLGQPNSGKTTLFNALTGSRQHVGNWPGKTVEQKEGYFTSNDIKFSVVDLPGSYSLSANSEEEIITREYIASGKADLVCILVDASQLERSLYMVADYVGMKTPAILLLNMMDIAADRGKTIDYDALQNKLGVPVLPFVAAERKKYDSLFETLATEKTYISHIDEKALQKIYCDVVGDSYIHALNTLPDNGIGKYSAAWLAAKIVENDLPALEIASEHITAAQKAELQAIAADSKQGNLLTAESKFEWIGNLLQGCVQSNRDSGQTMTKFDRCATSKRWGKPIAIGIVLLGLVSALVIAAPFMMLFSNIPALFTPIIEPALTSIGAPNMLISLICDGILTAIYFALSMTSFVLGISLVFGFIEEIGYMARISYVFDSTMSKLGLQGKAMMPFLVSFGCNIGGVSGTRVIDSWGQRVLTMALAWVVPCAASWGVVGLISTTFFGSGAVLVVIALFLTAFLHMMITAKVFGRKLVDEETRTGLIMELPPYHKPKYKNLFRFVADRVGDVLFRALKMILLVFIVFWALSYSADGDISHSIIYRIGMFIEPVTMWFGLRWQTFMAFVASGIGKEASLGVLSSVLEFNMDGGVWNFISGQASVDSAALSGTIVGAISKAEALAFLFAFWFNIPCIMTLAATAQESHSIKWTVRILAYYIGVALLMAAIAYRVGLLIF